MRAPRRIADLRNLSVPELTHTLSGHSKAISYVRFPDPDHVLSASTDSTLKLWSLRSSEVGPRGRAMLDAAHGMKSLLFSPTLASQGAPCGCACSA